MAQKKPTQRGTVPTKSKSKAKKALAKVKPTKKKTKADRPRTKAGRVTGDALVALLGKSFDSEDFEQVGRRLRETEKPHSVHDVFYLEYREGGIKFRSRRDRVAVSLLLNVDAKDPDARKFVGILPWRLAATDSQARVHKKLGKPVHSEKAKPPDKGWEYFGPIPAWDEYKLELYLIRITYDLGESSITYMTIDTPDATKPLVKVKSARSRSSKRSAQSAQYKTNSSHFKLLKKIVVPPDKPQDDTGNWATVEKKTKTQLPADYKQFIAAYGTGCFGDATTYFWIDNLLRRGAAKALESDLALWRSCRKTFPDNYDHGIFPSRPGYFPLGGDVDGGSIAWVVDGPPDSWPLVAKPRNAGAFEVFEMSLTTFLFQAITHKIRPEVWRPDFPQDPYRVTFVAGEQYHRCVAVRSQ